MARGHEATEEFHQRKLIEARRLLALMEPQPAPMPALQLNYEEHVSNVRRVHCARYSACLNLAYAARWPGFSCNACGAYRLMGKEEYLSDVDGIGNLLIAIHRGM